MNLVPSFQSLMQIFSSEMSCPNFRNFCQILIRWFFTHKHLISQAIVLSGNAGTRHHTAFYRVFSNAA